jgi:lysophospholipase L1-like esterase
MPTILCFGDSNTWGTVPMESRRYTENERWPALLQKALVADFTVIEEGQQGRTIVHNNPFQGVKSGQRYLKDCLEMHVPDLVLILLGTNDLKKRFSLSAADVAKNASDLAQRAQQYKNSSMTTPCKVLLIAPPPVYEVGFYAKMYAGAAAKSVELAKYYALYAEEVGCAFFDAGLVVTTCKEEGIHWQVQQHQFLADALVPILTSLVNKRDI